MVAVIIGVALGLAASVFVIQGVIVDRRRVRRPWWFR